MRSRRRVNWFQQWNYNAPLVWASEYVKKSKRFRKTMYILTAIIIGFVAEPIVRKEASTVIANYYEAKLDKEKKIQQDILLAKKKEELRIQEQREQFIKKELNENALKNAEERKVQRMLDELNSTIHVGDWVEITWWGPNYPGPVPPEYNFRTGQVESIDGFKITGSWGDWIIDWTTHPNFVVIGQKEYSKLRREEEDKLARRIAKSSQKKINKSWGVFPGTVHTVDGVKYISVVENGKLVDRIYKK